MERFAKGNELIRDTGYRIQDEEGLTSGILHLASCILHLASCILHLASPLMFLLIPALCFAQIGGFDRPPETLSTFTGAQFYSRTLGSEEGDETVQQIVVPFFIKGSITDNLDIKLYQTVSNSQLKDGPSLSGLESTRIQASLSLFGNSVLTYLGCRLPIISKEPEIETAYLINLLYSDALQFGVSRLTEGFDVDGGLAYALSLGDLSLGLGAGYVLRGMYDTLLYGADLVEYNPGDAINASAGLHFLRGPTSLRGRAVYVHYLDDTIEGDDAFKSGDEISFLASAAFRLDPLIFMLYTTDTMKGESDALQEALSISNVFKYRLTGGISLAYELLDELLILKTRASAKSLIDDNDDGNANVFHFDGGFQLIPMNDLTVDILAGLVYGNMDDGETDISGFNLSLIMNYGF